MRVNKTPELLAPAGEINALKAAINGGADAVYLGLDVFSARKRAKNFTFKELEEALRQAHDFGIKVYVTFNTLVKESELNEAVDVLNRLIRMDIDGLIIQDVGILSLLLNQRVPFSIQVSTQASVYTNSGIRFFERLGVDRVVFSRETALKDVKRPGKVETKAFCHGALCYAYSGQCHLSAALGGRSGNRGNCAQPCRRHYVLTKDNKKIKDGFLLSTKELNTLEHVDDLKHSPVDSLKIEGRMRSPEYVYAVSKAYRHALDGEPNPEDLSDIEAVFSRDFTPGRLFGAKHNLSQSIPKKRGSYIGTTGKFSKGKLELILEEDIELVNGDGISFGEKEETGTYVNGIFLPDGEKVKIGKKKVLIPYSKAIRPGVAIYRSFNKRRLDKLKREALKQPENSRNSVPVDFYITIKEDSLPKVTAVLEDGTVAEFTGSEQAEIARSRSLSIEEVKNRFSKLGSTGFVSSEIYVDLDDGLFLPVSTLNQLRNKTIELLKQEKSSNQETRESLLIKLPEKKKRGEESPQTLSVRFESLPEYSFLKDLDVDEIVLTVKNPDDPELLELLEKLNQNHKRVLLTVPAVTGEEEIKRYIESKDEFLKLAELSDGILVPNYDFFEYVRDMNLPIEASENFNVFNSLSAEFLLQQGFQAYTVSDELNADEIRELTEKSSLPAVMIIAGKRNLMISDNCVIDCAECVNCPNEGWYELENDMDDHFKLKIESGKNYIYNSEITMIPEAFSEQPFINKFRINITDESDGQVREIVKKLRDFKFRKKDAERNPGNYRTGVL